MAQSEIERLDKSMPCLTPFLYKLPRRSPIQT